MSEEGDLIALAAALGEDYPRFVNIYFEEFPESAYRAAQKYGNVDLARRSLERLIETDPHKAFWMLDRGSSIEVITEVMETYIARDPTGAYHTMTHSLFSWTGLPKDWQSGLWSKVANALIVRSPQEAYDAAKRSGDVSLMRLSVQSGVEKGPV